jgi:hypothetical protein
MQPTSVSPSQVLQAESSLDAGFLQSWSSTLIRAVLQAEAIHPRLPTRNSRERLRVGNEKGGLIRCSSINAGAFRRNKRCLSSCGGRGTRLVGRFSVLHLGLRVQAHGLLDLHWPASSMMQHGLLPD